MRSRLLPDPAIPGLDWERVTVVWAITWWLLRHDSKKFLWPLGLITNQTPPNLGPSYEGHLPMVNFHLSFKIFGKRTKAIHGIHQVSQIWMNLWLKYTATSSVQSVSLRESIPFWGTSQEVTCERRAFAARWRVLPQVCFSRHSKWRTCIIRVKPELTFWLPGCFLNKAHTGFAY